MPALFVAGTGTDVGKTYVTAALLRALAAAGDRVDALKPVASGFDPADPGPSDAAALLAALGRPLTAESLDRICPSRFRAPIAPDQAAALEGVTLSADAIATLCRERAAEAGEGLLVVESAGGIMSPLDADATMLDLALSLGAPVLLVAGSYLGAISHTLTAARALAQAGLGVAAIALSETAREPPFASNLAEIGRRLTPTPVFGLRRGEDCPEGLAEAVRAACRA
ncbi:MAG: dethiobiotin synthase [Caulobacteraceae bacterium]